MRLVKHLVLTLFVVACLAVHSFAQQTVDCMTLYEKVTEKYLQPSSGMHVIEYGVQTISKKASKENRVKIYSDSSHRYIITDMVQVYMDKDHSIMLAPYSKTIMINYTDAKGEKSLKEPQSDLADSLFKSTVYVTACEEVTGNVLYDREMTVKPKNKNTDFVKSVYFIKSTDLSIYKMSLTYNKADYERVDYTFYEDRKGLPNDKINKPIMDLFFKKDGTLLPLYKGYRVTDNRIISSKN